MPALRGKHKTTYPRYYDGRELPSYLPDELVGKLEVTRMSDSEYDPIQVAELAMEEVYESGEKGIAKMALRLIVIEVIKKLGCPGGAASELASRSYMERVVKYLRATKKIQPTRTPDTYTVLPKAPVSIDRDMAIQQLLETCERQKESLEERQVVIRDQSEQIEKLTEELQSLKELPPAGADPELVEQLLLKCEELEDANRTALLKFEETVRAKQAEINKLQDELTQSMEAQERVDALNVNLSEQLEELRRQLMALSEERDELATKVETLEKVTPRHKELDAGTMDRLRRLGIK